ncbi:NUDIX hydrolase [Candidatus Gracilibacteria bacterium]|nr:NUDIX hydrolase [Candidatus Gracilibacteria bacterium]
MRRGIYSSAVFAKKCRLGILIVFQSGIGVFKQSGVIPYRIREGKIEILLVTSSSGKNWIVPKGWIEPFMNSIDSAAKEAREEAGILGSLLEPAIGTYRDRKLGFTYSVEIFLMRVETILEEWAEASKRKRRWYSLSKASDRVKKAELKQILEKLRSHHQLSVTSD